MSSKKSLVMKVSPVIIIYVDEIIEVSPLQCQQ